MCDICRSSPCLAGCPNAPGPKVVNYCHECGDDIYEGDKYINENVPLCKDCIENMSAMELIDFLDIEIHTAKFEEPDYD